jgi:hypothetical protein
VTQAAAVTTTAVAPGVGDAAVPGQSLTQHVRVEFNVAYALVAAHRATDVVLPAGTELIVGPDGTLHPDPPLARADTYVVTSSVVGVGPDRLRAADPLRGPIPGDVAAAYLPLPAVTARVRALASEVAGGETTGYDKVLALQGWLAANTRQTSAAPGLAPGVDPVDQFLFVDRSGPPVRAASAVAVLVREIGIPARLAIGFLPGHRSAFGGPYLVRGRDASAWVEVWFPGIGWQPFDAAGHIAPTTAVPAASLWERLRSLWPVAVVLLAFAIGIWFWRRQRVSRRVAPRRWVTVAFARLEEVGVQVARPRFRFETPAEYATALAAVLVEPRLVEVGAVFTAAAWSGAPPSPETCGWVDAVLAEASAAAAVRAEKGSSRGRSRARAMSR